MNIKINNKNYVVPQLGFKHMTQMEDMGFSVLEMLRKNQSFSLAAAFVGIVVNCDREDAEQLIEQHLYGGGKMEPIYAAFNKAMEESDFFKKLLEMEEPEAEAEKKTTTKKTTAK